LKKKTGRGLGYTGLFNPKSRPPISQEKDTWREQNKYQLHGWLGNGFFHALLYG